MGISNSCSNRVVKVKVYPVRAVFGKVRVLAMTPAELPVDGALASEQLKCQAGRQDEWKYLEFP